MFRYIGCESRRSSAVVCSIFTLENIPRPRCCCGTGYLDAATNSRVAVSLPSTLLSSCSMLLGFSHRGVLAHHLLFPRKTEEGRENSLSVNARRALIAEVPMISKVGTRDHAVEAPIFSHSPFCFSYISLSVAKL